MLKPILIILGWGCAHAPEWLLHGLSFALGRLLFWTYTSRRRLMLGNLAQAFPQHDAAWCRRTAQASCQRLIETSLISLAAPFLTPSRIRILAAPGPSLQRLSGTQAHAPRPIFLGTVHLAYWEGLTWVPLLLAPKPLPPFVSVYRPLRQAGLDAWLRRTRERFGVRLLSRRGGLHAALHTLKRGGGVSILFDQNAGSNGVLTTFFGRDCSTTPLPGMLVERAGGDVDVVILYTRRTAFWRFTIEVLPVTHDGTAASVILGLNRAFENLLRSDDDLCASWLWLHHRWKILQLPADLARLRAKRGILSSAEFSPPSRTTDPSPSRPDTDTST